MSHEQRRKNSQQAVSKLSMKRIAHNDQVTFILGTIQGWLNS